MNNKSYLFCCFSLASVLCLPLASNAVTLYGIMEEGVVLTKAKNKAAVVELKSGFDQGCRWGIKGEEDLGNGYNVGFILEQGFSADNGNAGDPSKAFNRETLIRLGSNIGRLSFGRTGALGSGAQSHNILSGWAFSTGYLMSGWNSMSVKTVRLDNTIAYVSPSLNGLTLYGMYSNKTTGTDEEKWSLNPHYYGIGAKYRSTNLLSSLIWEMRDFKPEHHERDMVVNYGIEYTINNWTPMFAYQWYNKDGGLNTHMFGISAKANILEGDLRIGARFLFGKDRNPESEQKNVNLFNVGAAFIYPLSKRTALKSYIGYVRSGQKWRSEKDYLYNGYAAIIGLRTSF